MSSVKKCDRCGHMFDPYSIGKRKFVRFRNPAFEDEDAVRQNKVAFYLLESNQYGCDAIVDLCPDCTEDFECFMDNYPLALRTNDDPEKVTDGEPYLPPGGGHPEQESVKNNYFSPDLAKWVSLTDA